MVSSINNNIAAFYAQANIATATTESAASVARLSSGNRIVEASDDVTALAIGTSLGSTVSALNTAATNASQGSSLLQVADGTLAQIQSILQQQQSIANQAQSGSLTDTDRGFLNQQFQALTSEIDSLAKGTTFNGVTLLDGSIATGGSNEPLQNTTFGSTGANAAATIGGFSGTANVTAAAFALDSTTFNDTSFAGNLSQGVFTAAGDGGNGGSSQAFQIGYTIGGSVYTGLLASSGTTVTLDNGLGKITLTVSAFTKTAVGSDVVSQLNTAFAGATAYAIHKVSSTLATDSAGNNIAGSAITASMTAGTLFNGFSGANITMQSSLFSGKQLPPIADWSATGSGASTQFSVIIDGTTYSTGNGDVVSSPTVLNAAQWGSDTAGHLILYAKGNSSSSQKIDLTLTGVIGTSALITTTSDVQNVVNALNGIFGSGGQSGGLTFQLGTTATSNVAVNIANSQSSALFSGATLDVSNQGDATTAAATVTTALNTITATRSGVGSLETEFNFAAAAIQVGVQNQTAAKSALLDTDIASESTNFATEQVKLQAGISVLAQANQQLQALLKLIG